MTDKEKAELYLDPIHRMYSCNNEYYTDEVILQAYLDGLSEGRKELEKDRHELLERIKAIKEVLNIEEIYRLKKRNEELLKALNGLHEATIEGQWKK